MTIAHTLPGPFPSARVHAHRGRSDTATEMSVGVWMTSCDGGELRVEVGNNGPRQGRPDTRDAIGGECGRGLSIVAQLTDWCCVDVQAFSWHVRAGFRVAE
ncbi:hypothetical protein [Streptomyces sp. SYSU K217416]